MRCPFATWRPLPENAYQAAITPTQLIVHTAVDQPGPTSLYSYFSRAEVGAESHFFIRTDGRIEQYIDTQVKANANRTADARAISIETEDDGDPVGNPWSGAQLQSLERLLLWCSDVHGIPLALCSAHDAPGVGWHSQWGFADSLNQKGGTLDNPWSYYKGKTCPGPTRIKQLLNDVLPSVINYRRAASLLTPAKEVSAMNDAEITQWVRDTYKMAWGPTAEPDPEGFIYWSSVVKAEGLVGWAKLVRALAGIKP